MPTQKQFLDNVGLTELLDELGQYLKGKLDVITDLDTIRAGAAAGATAYQKPSTGIPKSDLSSSVLTSLGKADTALQQHQDLSSYADGAEYDSTNHLIYLKHGSTRLANPINANDFIKDGMVDTVEITGGNLVITFNTDSGKLPITIPISDIFDANNYYNKTESDARYLLSFTETDPIFSASPAAGITSSDIDYWDNKLNKITPPVVGSLYRNDVSGTGVITIRGTKGLFPTVTSADTYTVITKMLSSTQSYGLSVNFGGNTYTLNTTNGLIEDTRQITVNAGATWSGSVVGTVAANTILDVKLFSSLDEITTVGITAITNSYNDLDNKPTIPTVYNGKLTIQKNGTQVATFNANQSSNATANITVPTKVSELDNDSGFITGYTETDPTVPSWAKQSTKPSYTASEVGALPSTTFIPSKTSDLTNDSGFITGYTETDPIYSASVAAGITSGDISNWNSKTSNIGTITGITMNGVSKGTSGVVNLGTVVTSETDPVFTASVAHGITSADITNWNNKLDSYTETDPTVPSHVKSITLTNINAWNEAEANVQSDWNQTTTTADDYIKNKPDIPDDLSDLNDDSTHRLVTDTEKATWNGKQDTLVSGTNLKTINNESLLGSGNIDIQGGGSSMSITYNANTKTLIIGSGSVNTYTITFNIESGFSVRINGGEPIMNQSPISVNEGDSISGALIVEDRPNRPTVTMGGESIVVYSEGPETFYFTIESVTGDIVVSV